MSSINRTNGDGTLVVTIRITTTTQTTNPHQGVVTTPHQGAVITLPQEVVTTQVDQDIPTTTTTLADTQVTTPTNWTRHIGITNCFQTTLRIIPQVGVDPIALEEIATGQDILNIPDILVVVIQVVDIQDQLPILLVLLLDTLVILGTKM